MRYYVFILFFAVILATTQTVVAQINPMSSNELDIQVIPQNPKPNEIVNIILASYATDINAANITWSINGKVQKNGVGLKNFTFTAGDIGSKTNLQIEVQTKEGEVITNTINISPVSVDLMWQSKSYVPPFYKGKAMFSHQNSLTIIAIPHIVSNGQEISAKKLIYIWKKDGSVSEQDSGYGKNTFTFDGSLISRPVMVEVSVSSAQTGDTGYAHTTLTPIEPKLIFYKKDPLYGIEFQKALSGDVGLGTESEINVLGIPMFYGVTNKRNADLTYNWSVNGFPINSELNRSSQVFRRKEGEFGKSNISLDITSESKILQYSSGNFNINFDNNTQ